MMVEWVGQHCGVSCAARNASDALMRRGDANMRRLGPPRFDRVGDRACSFGRQRGPLGSMGRRPAGRAGRATPSLALRRRRRRTPSPGAARRPALARRGASSTVRQIA